MTEHRDIFKIMQARNVVEKEYEWRKWIEKIPFIDFPERFMVKVIPPFGGAIVRFHIKDSITQKQVSVYLDCYDELGLFGEPYWEIFPHLEDIYRVKMNNTEELIKRITEQFDNNNTSL